MRSRTGRAASLLALALLLPASGCCTIVMWHGAPTIEPAKVTGATVDEQGALAIGVEWSDGSEVAYRETTRYFNAADPANLCVVFARALDPAAAPRFDHAPSDDGDRVEITDWKGIADPASGPVDVVLHRTKGGALEILGKDGVKRGFVEIHGREGINWMHPGTWLRVVATPVTVAVDVVTFPVQFVLFFFILPSY